MADQVRRDHGVVAGQPERHRPPVKRRVDHPVDQHHGRPAAGGPVDHPVAMELDLPGVEATAHGGGRYLGGANRRRAATTRAITGPPRRSAVGVQPHGSRAERPGPRRARRPRHRRRPSWTSSTRGVASASLARSRNRLRGGAAGESSAVNASGDTHHNGCSQRIGTRALGHRSPIQVPDHAGGDVTTRERRDVGGLRSMEHISRGEHARDGSCAGLRSTAGPKGRRVEGRSPQHGELVIGDPVGGEDHQIARHLVLLAGVEVGELDRLHPAPPADRGEPGARSGAGCESAGRRRPGRRPGSGGGAAR